MKHANKREEKEKKRKREREKKKEKKRKREGDDKEMMAGDSAIHGCHQPFSE